MSEGGPQASRAIGEPSYLTSGDPGMAGGGTVTDASTKDQMTAYENIFGPSAREVKFDSQRNKRHQRWHLPDALRGPNMFLTDRIDGLITDATNSPFTKNILPYMYVDQPDKKIKWNVYSFDEGVASRVPYEAAARVLPQSKRTFSGYAVRQGLAIAMEHNFMMSPAGMDNFRKQLQQLVGSIQMTNDLDVHMALLLAPSYQKQMDEKYYDNTVTTAQNCRMYTDLFGFMAKNENALDFLIEDAKNHLQTWGSKPPTFMLCNRALTKGLTMNPEKTMYCTNGPDGKQRLAAGPELPSYRGLSFINTRKFSLDAGTAPRDLMRRRVRVSEHYRIPWTVHNVTKRYEFYDQSRDSMFYLSWYQLWEASMPSFEDSDKLLKFLGAITTQKSSFYTTADLSTSVEDIFTEKSKKFTGADKWSFQQFWNLGAWLGFWAACDVQNINKQCPIFLKNYLECVTYSDEGKLLRHWKMAIKNDEDDVKSAELDVYVDIIAEFIIHTANKNKQNLQSILDTASSKDAVKNLITDTIPDADAWKAQKASGSDRNVVFPCDLFLLRPNIEHYMLGIIFGRGGGPEELGATFWGQTELSVYDDTQHGIWGMSYKYHERAIVTNERNLIRVFDIAFDGYCGGNDSRIMKWDETDVRNFSDATKDTTKAYGGPSMIVFALPTHDNTFDSFPNPVVIHPVVNASDATNAVPDRSLKFNDIHKHCCFANAYATPGVCDWATDAIHKVFSLYYSTLNVEEWNHIPAMSGTAGSLSSSDETSVNIFSFSGQMAVVDQKGNREETQGSGHLGPSFVGVASVREGRGCLQTTRQAVMRNMNM
jgi:hypothetical protein